MPDMYFKIENMTHLMDSILTSENKNNTGPNNHSPHTNTYTSTFLILNFCIVMKF